MKKILHISLGLVILAILSFIIGIKFLFKPAIEMQIQEAGFPKAQIGAASLNFSGAKLSKVTLDVSGNTIEEIDIAAAMSDLLKTKATKVTVQGVRLSWPLSLPPAAIGAAAGSLNLFTREIDFKDVVIAIQSPLGPMQLVTEGTLVDNGATYDVTATANANPAFGRIEGKLTASINKATRVVKARYDIAAAQLQSPNVELKAVTGWLTAETDPARPLPLLNAQLAIGGLKAYGVPLQATTLTLSSTPDKMEGVLTGQVINDSGDVMVNLKIDQSDKVLDALYLNAEAKLQHLDALEAVDMAGEGSLILSLNGAHAKAGGWGDMSQWQKLTGSLGLDMQKLSLPGLLSGAEALATLQLALDPATRQVAATAADGPMTFSGKVKALGNRSVFINIAANKKTPAAVTWDSKAQTVKADIEGADIAALDFMAKGISSHLTTYLGDAPVVEGRLGIDQLRHNTQVPYFMPVKVALQFQPQNKLKSGTGFSGDISEKNGHFAAKIQGQYDSAGGKGDISLNMPPTTFIQNVTPVAASFPVSQNFVQDAFGTLGFSARLTFGKGKNGWSTDTQGQVFLKDFTCTVKDNVISGISTVLNLDNLMPPVVTKQTIAVGALNVGLPLTDGVVVMSLDAARNFTLHSAEWNAAGGKISSSPFTMPLATMNTSATLTATGLDLQQLFQIAPMEGLSAQGAVNGTLPLQMNNGSFSISNGVLQTTGPGTIRYNPQTVPSFLQNPSSQQIIDLKAALTAFNFDSLKMTVDGEIGKSQKISLQISGRNPLFYSGHPVNFNLNVEGPIENILKYSPGSSRIPDSIRKQMEDYEAKHGKT